MGISTASLALRMCLRYSSGPVEFVWFRKICQRLGKTLGAVGEIMVQE